MVCLLALTAPAYAAVNGAIQTTTSDGKTVNANIYGSKDAVYLTGGPQNEQGNGLVPDGTYYFQVTDPSGATLLSTDDISCRAVVVSGGKIIGVPSGAPPATCTTGYHALGTFNSANGEMPVQLMPYNDTPNPGGEYKAWLTPVANYAPGTCTTGKDAFGFCDSDSKTDNFKIKPNVAHVTVCKFNDLNGDASQEPGEPLLPHWPITATGVDNDSQTNTTVNTQTGDSGCVTFAVSTFSNASGTQTVTLSEGTFGPDWSETAPLNGACTLTGNNGTTPSANDICSVNKPTITLTVSPTDEVTAPYFGNNNPFCNTTGCTAQGLVVSKSAAPSFTRKFTWGITKSVDQTQVNTAGSATFNYTVNVTHDAGTDSAWQVTGTIIVANPTGTDITGVTVTDAVDDGGTCAVTDTPGGLGETVPAGSHIDLPYTCAYTAAPSSAAGTNTATATANGNPVTGTAGFDFGSATPTVVDGSITVTDTLGGSLGTVNSTDPSPTTFTYSKTFTDPAGTCTTHPNTATFTATDNQTVTGSSSQTVKVCVGADLTVSKTATPTFTSSISKSVDKTEIDTNWGGNATFNYTVTATESAWKVSGSVTVTNPNDWESINANVSDVLSDSGGSCSFTGGSAVTLAPSGSTSVPYTCTFSSAPGVSGTNTATAAWDKAASFTPGGSASGRKDYTFGSLAVTDTIGGTLGTITAPAASTTFNYSKTVTAPAGTCNIIQNTASITGGPSDSKSVKVCGASPLTISKTAVPTLTSAITKKANQTSPDEVSGSTTLTYTITATESGWNVSGVITVVNPNDWEPIGVNLSDVLSDPKGSCTITGGNSQTVLQSSSITPAYSCSFSGAPAANGSNTATVSWNGTTAHTLVGSAASAPAPYAFALLTVTDTFNNGTPKVLGSKLVPAASYTYTDSYTVNETGGSCVTYPNVASITGGPSANASVTVCNTKTGALTMGFWQNKNGQGIITSDASTGGVCNLDTWLRQYAPFQDLSATPPAPCSAVASYVFNIIKAANAAGTSMNAMLKAQMLATALDVYFSTPGLGGNLIGAAQPLGGVKINLTQVCNMVDGSSGSGTCSGTSGNASAAFGGATSGTVSFLLSYAATQSNADGSIWYAQNKAIQGLAKNTFDAINNQAANIAP